MAKASVLYYGNNSAGNKVDVAKRESDGKWFSRYEEKTNYGYKMCKWYESEEPRKSVIKNEYSGEVCGKAYFWGFNKLSELKNPSVRLPN